jgi:hypothetical protein
MTFFNWSSFNSDRSLWGFDLFSLAGALLAGFVFVGIVVSSNAGRDDRPNDNANAVRPRISAFGKPYPQCATFGPF